MAIWLDDLIEQVATAMALADSETETGKRLALIIVDNAVEFLMKAYVEFETQLIGAPPKLTNRDWEQKKRVFDDVLDFVYSKFTITASKTDIVGYHDIRNKLYHEGKPFSIGQRKVMEYAELLKTMLNDLHKFKMSDDQCRKRAYEVSLMIAKKEAQTKIVITYTSEKGQTRFEKPDVRLSDSEAIMLSIHAHSHYFGEPSPEDIEGILIRSGHSLEKPKISKGISNLKSGNSVWKDRLLLRPTAVDRLRKKFAIVSAPATV